MRRRQFGFPCTELQWVGKDPKARDERMQVQEKPSGGGCKSSVHTQGALGTSMRRPHSVFFATNLSGPIFFLAVLSRVVYRIRSTGFRQLNAVLDYITEKQ